MPALLMPTLLMPTLLMATLLMATLLMATLLMIVQPHLTSGRYLIRCGSVACEPIRRRLSSS